MDYQETSLDHFSTFDESSLDVHLWEAENPKAIILAIHGGLAHGGDYVNVGLYFKEKNITTISYDLRGHKQEKVKLKKFEDYVEDTLAFYHWSKNKFPELPIFFVSHSMGGLIVTKLRLEKLQDEKIAGFVFSSPYFANLIKVPKLLEMMAGIFAKLIPNAKLKAEDLTPNLTHDEVITNRHRKDEELMIRAKFPSIRFGAEILGMHKWIAKNIHLWKEKSFFIIAGQDKLADSDVIKEYVAKMDPDITKISFYEDNYHENFNELNRNEIFDEINNWFSEILN